MVGIFVFHGSIHLIINLQEAFEASRVMLQRNYIDASFLIRASVYVRILFFVFFLLLPFNELDLVWTYMNTPTLRRLPVKTQYEPRHEISNNVVCATSKGSDQPARTHMLVRAFASIP